MIVKFALYFDWKVRETATNLYLFVGASGGQQAIEMYTVFAVFNMEPPYPFIFVRPTLCLNGHH